MRGRNDSVHRVCTVATVLTFDELTNREIIPQTYGDLIATANTGSFVYGDLVGALGRNSFNVPGKVRLIPSASRCVDASSARRVGGLSKVPS